MHRPAPGRRGAARPSNLREGRLRFTYSKNGSQMDIPVAAPLAEVIAKTNMTGTKAFLVTD
jgi:hypothetical protein